MKTSKLLKIIGEPRGEFIVSGRYGNAFLCSNGFVLADPCYIFGHDDGSWGEFLEAWWGEFGDDAARKAAWAGLNAWLASRIGWNPVTFRGQTAYVFNTGGDGESEFGLSTDSGTNAAIPYDLLPQRIKDMIVVREIEETATA